MLELLQRTMPLPLRSERGLYGIMEKKMGSYDLGLYWDYVGVIWGLYGDNAKENGNYYLGLYLGYTGIVENGNYTNGLYRVWGLGFWMLRADTSKLEMESRSG